MNIQGVLVTNFRLINFATILCINPDSFRACVKIKLIRTKYTTQLPKDAPIIAFNDATPVLANNITARKAGQTVSTRERRSTVAMNTPITFIPIEVIGSTGGKNQNRATIAKQATIDVNLFFSMWNLELTFEFSLILLILYLLYNLLALHLSFYLFLKMY